MKETARLIRDLAREGASERTIARQVGVHRNTVRKILRGEKVRTMGEKRDSGLFKAASAARAEATKTLIERHFAEFNELHSAGRVARGLSPETGTSALAYRIAQQDAEIARLKALLGEAA